jgi:hypothetical protein
LDGAGRGGACEILATRHSRSTPKRIKNTKAIILQAVYRQCPVEFIAGLTGSSLFRLFAFWRAWFCAVAGILYRFTAVFGL